LPASTTSPGAIKVKSSKPHAAADATRQQHDLGRIVQDNDQQRERKQGDVRLLRFDVCELYRLKPSFTAAFRN
jgi:hypothetical protein